MIRVSKVENGNDCMEVGDALCSVTSGKSNNENKRILSLLREMKDENKMLKDQILRMDEEIKSLKLLSLEEKEHSKPIAIPEGKDTRTCDVVKPICPTKTTKSTWKILRLIRGFLSPHVESNLNVSEEEMDQFLGEDDNESGLSSAVRKRHNRTRENESLTLTTKGNERQEQFLMSNIENDKDHGTEFDDIAIEKHSYLNQSFSGQLMERVRWLVGLLILQSCSSFILRHNEALLQSHPEIVHFLTMLVGAGGNAGNQACVRVIRELALGTLTKETTRSFLFVELTMAFCISGILAVTGLARATVFFVPIPETTAITASLWIIVLVSIILGALLPLVMKFIGIDPAHSSTTIQVLMDILGVTITVLVSSAMLSTRLSDET